MWYDIKERVARWLAWMLPKRVVKWCALRVAAHATTGIYGDTVVPEITFMDALARWDSSDGKDI